MVATLARPTPSHAHQDEARPVPPVSLSGQPPAVDVAALEDQVTRRLVLVLWDGLSGTLNTPASSEERAAAILSAWEQIGHDVLTEPGIVGLKAFERAMDRPTLVVEKIAALDDRFADEPIGAVASAQVIRPLNR